MNYADGEREGVCVCVCVCVKWLENWKRGGTSEPAQAKEYKNS